MKTIKRNLFTVILSLVISVSSFAQLEDVANMISGIQKIPNDIEYLFNGYITPYTNAIGSNLNAAWYNTAKPHKLGGFDLTITFNATFIPDEDKTMDISGLQKLEVVENAHAQTVAGSNDEGPLLQYRETFNDLSGDPHTQTFAEFRTPPGTGLPVIPTPMIQLGIGLVKGTEIVGRYMPTLKIGSMGKIGLWGVGVKHDVKQWIPVMDKLPVLNISVLGGYTKFSSKIDVKISPEDLQFDPSISIVDNSSIAYDDQNMTFDVKSFTANLLVSADLPVVTFYGGIGFATIKSELAMNGTYPLPTFIIDETSADFPGLEVNDQTVRKDPLSLDNKYTKARMNIGMRLKLGVLTIHGDYTYSSYSVVTGGIGVSFR